MQNRMTTDRIIIVGAGLGALYAALKLAPRPVVMISPEVLGQGASSAWAQGGVAAAMANTDSPESHARDTLNAGAGTVDKTVAAFVTEEARQHILDLTNLGTPFDRDEEGKFILSREAAHSYARVVRVKGDQAGAQIMAALIDQVRECPSVQVLENVMASLLDASGTRPKVTLRSASEGGSNEIELEGPAILLAGGGSGGLYAVTTNPPRIRGQIIGMAARAGAVIADAEFVQFHPTAMDLDEDPAPLATEALRGEGAILVNSKGERFMLAAHKEAELAPRDVVAREIYAQWQSGLKPMLDTRQAIGRRIKTHYPAVAEACARHGIDPEVDMIPVAAAAHYHMGGVETDAHGKSSLANVWVCGEASSTGLHGANRLASNGLLEALVFARRAAKSISASVENTEQADAVQLSFQEGKTLDRAPLVQKLRSVMTACVGVVRNEGDLRKALCEIHGIEQESQDDHVMLTMTATATLIAAAAYLRRESRGAHERSDYPYTDIALAKRSRLTLNEAMALRSRLVREDL